ncbi:hypothetical protein ACQKLN_18425 [Paenibacillus glucanolyticus]|uniref:hypothetical protein n=1 Tax=Paenibacillus glucanolyticus TaxID=59843 RepID=UPI003D045BBB
MFIEAVPDGILDTFKEIKTSEAFEERMRITVEVEEYFPEITARNHSCFIVGSLMNRLIFRQRSLRSFTALMSWRTTPLFWDAATVSF